MHSRPSAATAKKSSRASSPPTPRATTRQAAALPPFVRGGQVGYSPFVICHCERSEAISLKFSCHVIKKLIAFAVTGNLVSRDRQTDLLNS